MLAGSCGTFPAAGVTVAAATVNALQLLLAGNVHLAQELDVFDHAREVQLGAVALVRRAVGADQELRTIQTRGKSSLAVGINSTSERQ